MVRTCLFSMTPCCSLLNRTPRPAEASVVAKWHMSAVLILPTCGVVASPETILEARHVGWWCGNL